MRAVDLVKIGARRLANEIREEIYISGGPDGVKPQAIGAMVTERCNYKCLSCIFWRQESYPQEMELHQWQKALRDLQEFLGGFTIQFSGGEPFVYRPFVPLVEWCGANGIRWGVTTNGSSLSRTHCERIANARPLNVNISVDGATAKVHDHSRGVPGSLDRIEQGILHLREARERLGADFAIRIKPTVHHLNVQEMPALVDWAVANGATSIDFSPVRDGTPEVQSVLWIHRSDDKSLHEAVARLLELKRNGAPIETEDSKISSWPAHFRGETVVPTMAPCRVGLRNYCILPDGRVRTCWMYPDIGSVVCSSAREIWEGDTARAQRAEMMKCANFGSIHCASSCLAHRSIKQDAKRALLLLSRRKGAPA